MRVNCYVKGHDGGSNCKQCLASHPTVPAPEGAAIACEFCYEDTFNIMADNRIVCAYCGTERPVTPQAAPLATNSGMGFGTPESPADAGVVAESTRKQIYDLWHKAHSDFGQASYQGFVKRICEAAITDYAKPLVERNKELEKYYDDALDYIDRGKAAEAKADSLVERIGELEAELKGCDDFDAQSASEAIERIAAAEARADSLQRELDELKEYEAEEAAFMAKHNVSYCTTFVDGWARVLDDRDSLAETLGRVRETLDSWKDISPLGILELLKVIDAALAALGPVAGEGKE